MKVQRTSYHQIWVRIQIPAEGELGDYKVLPFKELMTFGNGERKFTRTALLENILQYKCLREIVNNIKNEHSVPKRWKDLRNSSCLDTEQVNLHHFLRRPWSQGTRETVRKKAENRHISSHFFLQHDGGSRTQWGSNTGVLLTLCVGFASAN